MPEHDPKKTFLAAIRLAQLPFSSGLYWHDKMSKPTGETLCQHLLYTPQFVPSSGPGTMKSRGGLRLFICDGFPAWIETPWGEWRCWGKCDWPAPLECTARFIKLIDAVPIKPGASGHVRLDELRNGKVKSAALILRSVGPIAVPHTSEPSYEIAATTARENCATWFELCATYKKHLAFVPEMAA